jgi:hypothetical protein
MKLLLRGFLSVYILSLAFISPLSSCKKENFLAKGNLTFSADTIVFDTVFTTIGSTTKNFKLYNNDNRSILIEQIELMGGSGSPYRINVDGVSGNYHADIEVEGNDSLFIFVEVTLDPNSGTLPMVVEDSIRFRTNGVDQYVQLAAWGQDAYFHYSYISQGILDLNSGIWPNDKPHVIYGGAFIDSAETLTIQAGTEVFLHKNAILYNYKGTLNIEGTYTNQVYFRGDRLEPQYDDVAGQYYGIYLHEARECTFDYVNIKNGIAGIHLFSEDPSNSSYSLNLYNSTITNCASYGVWIYSGAKVRAENCIVAKNGVHSLLVLEGGDFNFNHCDLVGYGTGDGTAASVGISNWFTRPDPANNNVLTTFVGSIDEGTITNSVIYGNLDHELAIDTISDVGVTLNFNFDNNLIRSEDIFTSGFSNNIWNDDPQFVDENNGYFYMFAASPMVDAATPFYPITNPTTSNRDIRGTSRLTPDIGAYEYQ